MLLLSIFGGASNLASRLLAGGGEGEPSLLSVNPGLMIWTVVTFVLMMIVLRAVAWKPLLGVLDLRQQTIQGSLDQARQAQEEADKALAENRELLSQARQESDKILAESRDQAERGRAETLEQAREEARRLREQASQEIEAQKRAAIAEIRSQVSELAIAAAGRLLAEDLDGDRQRKLVEGYLSELEGQGGGSAGLPS